ncbi:MAG: DnaA/Hda family protein [Siculibacillus sp.]|nr:DnaA/Hda family protein [Siculibacillus sp.]
MAEAPRQLPLSLPIDAAHGRDDYVVTAANRAAFDLVTADRWPADVLLLIGPEGAGKTHLAAVFAEAAGARTVAASDLSRHDPLALAADAIVVEDAGEGVDERALFHLLNAVRQRGGRCLVTARRPPAEWRIELADLASRLRAATPVELGQPDDRLLEAVVAKLFADRQTTVDPAVVGYLARRMERSFTYAGHLVAELDREALAAKSPITRALAGSVLARGFGAEPELPGLDGGASAENNPS